MSFYCENCDKWWSYPIKRCIFCDNEIQEVIGKQFKVIGFTQVNVPSKYHKKVPYFNYLLMDENGNKNIIKSFEKYEIGDLVDLEEEKKVKNRYNVSIIGTGQMGLGIAEHLLRNGHFTVVKTRSDDNEVISKIKNRLLKDNTNDQVSEYMKNLKVVLDYSEIVDCDIIIEAVPEDIEIKKKVFSQLSEIRANKTIFATNTSSISIDEIADCTDRPENFIGMHFFNPVSRMDLIEVVIGEKTSDETKEWIINFSKDLDKKPILVNNSPGFIVNRLLFPQINDAVKLLEANVAKKEDIDIAIKLGLNHPMGPFALADFVGIDICVSILETLYKELDNKDYKPVKTFYDLLDEGKLGIKTGEGFYKYH